MQSKRFVKTKAKTLKQGSIFTFKSIRFPIEKNNQKCEKLLSEFYPEIDFDNSDYCIVLSQSCDVYYDEKRLPKDKTTHLVFGVLEPLKKYLDSELSFPDCKVEYIVEVDGEKKKYEFIDSQGIDTKIANKFSNILNNNHKYLFFVELKSKRSKLLIVNLNKLFSIKIEHYSLILEKVKYELKPEYSDKLGWKIAELFGRVGTDDYSDKDKNKIGSILHKEIFQKKMPPDTIYIDQKQFQKLKSTQKNLDKFKTAVENVLSENGIK